MKKKDQIREILLMAIYCDKKHDRILRIDNKIKTGQKYYSNADEDMSEFAGIHCLINSYLDQELKVDLYSIYNQDISEDFIEKALEKIEQRAECIAESKCAEELWHYFNDLLLF